MAVVTRDIGGVGPVFVLVHGIGVSSRYFERLVPALSPRGRVICVDLPGFGVAPRPAHPLTVADFALVLAAALDRLGVRNCVIVGHSMGTQVATRLALDRPDLVSALALLGPVMDPSDRGVVRAALRLGRDVLGESLRGNWVVLSDYVRCGMRWYLAILPSMLGYRIEEDLPRISVPVIVIRGVRDPIARRPWVAALAARTRWGRAVSVDGARHLVMHAQPQETAALIAGATA